MSDQKTFCLAHSMARRNALAYVAEAPEGWFVIVKPPSRSLDQNARMWAMLADIARQVEWHGKKLSSEDWKHIFTSSLKSLQVVPNLDGTGFVALGLSTSRMSVREVSELMELMSAFGAERGVVWSEVWEAA